MVKNHITQPHVMRTTNDSVRGCILAVAMRTGHALLLPILGCHALWGQAALRGLVDAHVHYNGDKAFLEKMAARLDPFDGTALILTQPKDIPDVLAAMKQHPKRFVGLGSIRLDDPQAVSLVDKFHDAGFRGLGELTGPLKSYDDKSYTPIYERAEKYGMIVLFHTGIVMRPNPDTPTDVSVDRMRVTTLDNIARRFPKLTIIGAHLGQSRLRLGGGDRAVESEPVFRPVGIDADQVAGELPGIQIDLLVVERGQSAHAEVGRQRIREGGVRVGHLRRRDRGVRPRDRAVSEDARHVRRADRKRRPTSSAARCARFSTARSRIAVRAAGLLPQVWLTGCGRIAAD